MKKFFLTNILLVLLFSIIWFVIVAFTVTGVLNIKLGMSLIAINFLILTSVTVKNIITIIKILNYSILSKLNFYFGLIIITLFLFSYFTLALFHYFVVYDYFTNKTICEFCP